MTADANRPKPPTRETCPTCHIYVPTDVMTLAAHKAVMHRPTDQETR